MDMKQAAEFFKTRWKYRKDPAWYAEQQAKKDKAAGSSPTNSGGGGNPAAPPSVDPKEAKKRKKQQDALHEYLHSMVKILDSAGKDDKTRSVRDQALKLLSEKEVEPEKLLEFGRELTKLEKQNKGLQQQLKQMRNAKKRNKDIDAWDRIKEEIERLDELERKGQKLEFSDDFHKTTMGIVEAFLGPAGPMFQTARMLYEEYKDDMKLIKGKYDKVTQVIKDRTTALRKTWARRGVAFSKMFPKLTLAMDKFAGAIDKGKSWFGRKFSKLRGGKWGKAFGAAKNFLSTEGGQAVTLLGVAGLAGLWRSIAGGDDKDEEKKKTEGEKSSVFSKDGIKALATKTKSKLATMFTDLTTGMGKKWDDLSDWAKTKYIGLIDNYRDLEIKLRIVKDVSNELQDRVWDGVTDWFSNTLEKIIQLIPEPVRKAAGWVQKQAKDITNTIENSAVGQAVSNAVGAIASSEPAQKTVAAVQQFSDKLGGDGAKNTINVAQVGDPSGGKDAVRVQAGVDLAGMNPALMGNFYAMAAEFYAKTGRKIQINSGKRDNAKQAALAAMYPGKAAKPGYSMHEYGLALDINSAEANMLEGMGLFKKYGFVRPVMGEAWHIEPMAIQGSKALIRKGKTDVASELMAGAGDAGVKSESEGVPSVSQAEVPAQKAPTGAEAVSPVMSVASATKTQQANSQAASAPTAAPQSAVSMPTATAPTATSMQMPVPIAPTVQPVVDSAYEAVSSRSKQVEKTVDATPPAPTGISSGDVTTKIGSNSVPLFLGDMGLLTLNLGVTA